MFTSVLSLEEIKSRITKYRQDVASGKLTNDDGLFTTIFGDHYSYEVETTIIPKGTEFYRARAIPDSDHFFPSKTIAKISDAWEAPKEYVTMPGRLNKAYQSILYCCPNDPNLAIDEARARGNKFVALMHYVSTRDIEVATLGNFKDSGLSKNESTNLFYSFLEEEFSIFVEPGQEIRYKLTQSIAESIFRLPNQDAWRYRSVQSPEKFNIAFLPDKGKECLKLNGVLLCDLTVYKEKYVVRAVIDFDSDNGNARLHKIGSEMQEQLFPNIRKIDIASSNS